MQDPRLSPAQKAELEVEIEAEVSMMLKHILCFHNSYHSLASAEVVISENTSIIFFGGYRSRYFGEQTKCEPQNQLSWRR